MAEIPREPSAASFKAPVVLGDLSIAEAPRRQMLPDSADISEAIFPITITESTQEEDILSFESPVIDGLKAGELSEGDLIIVKRYSQSPIEPEMGWHDKSACPGCKH